MYSGINIIIEAIIYLKIIANEALAPYSYEIFTKVGIRPKKNAAPNAVEIPLIFIYLDIKIYCI